MGSIEDDLWELIHGSPSMWAGDTPTDREVRRRIYNPVDDAMADVLDRIEGWIDVNSMGYARCSQLKLET